VIGLGIAALLAFALAAPAGVLIARRLDRNHERILLQTLSPMKHS